MKAWRIRMAALEWLDARREWRAFYGVRFMAAPLRYPDGLTTALAGAQPWSWPTITRHARGVEAR